MGYPFRERSRPRPPTCRRPHRRVAGGSRRELIAATGKFLHPRTDQIGGLRRIIPAAARRDPPFKNPNLRISEATDPLAQVFRVLVQAGIERTDLLKHGLAVPDKVSLIARDQDHVFEFVNPTISHYQFEGNAYVNHLSRLMLKLVGEGRLPAEPTYIFPEYFEGGRVKGHRV